jgi:signal peptidase I
MATFWDWTKQLGIALILALMIKTSIVEAYKIPSSSMENTLLVGDFLLANKFIYGMRLPIPFTNIKLPAIKEPKQGDIIIFKYPGDPRINRQDRGTNYIKRCIAVEGQKVKIVNKRVYVDDKLMPLPPTGQIDYTHVFPNNQNIFQWGPLIRDNMPEITVPKDKLFMMGDNRDNSSDSRFWGYADRDDVLGKAMIIHWSWNPWDVTDPNPANRLPSDVSRPPDISTSNPLSILESVSYNIYHLPERVRWSRIGDLVE